MMIYKLKTMGGTKIPICGEEKLNEFLKKVNSGQKLIITDYGIVNTTSIDSISPYTEMMKEIREEEMKYDSKEEEVINEVLGKKMFSEKTKLQIIDEGNKIS